jgi:hypothetical protein
MSIYTSLLNLTIPLFSTTWCYVLQRPPPLRRARLPAMPRHFGTGECESLAQRGSDARGVCLPSGKHTKKRWKIGKSQYLRGKSTINEQFSIAMSNFLT